MLRLPFCGTGRMAWQASAGAPCAFPLAIMEKRISLRKPRLARVRQTAKASVSEKCLCPCSISIVQSVSIFLRSWYSEMRFRPVRSAANPGRSVVFPRQARKKRGPFPSRSALFIPPCAVPGIHHAEGTAGGAVPAPHVLPGERTGRRSENVPVIPL